MGLGITVTVDLPFERAVEATRAALAEQGFGVLTEIDVQATLKAKLDEDVPPYLILGACRPQLAHQALALDPQIGLLMPCNVVVRAQGEQVVVEAFDPKAMVTITGIDELCAVTDEAHDRLTAAMGAVAATT
jgi:uncharacterized protein (DUF302 family)